ncbi:MAG: DUF927 domain-containing protein [Pyrinomonadaceae bacterium]
MELTNGQSHESPNDPILDELRAVSDEKSEVYELPKSFQRHSDGYIYFHPKDEEKNPFKVCSDIRVIATTCDADHQNWGLLLRFTDGQKHEHDLVIPNSLMSGDGGELRGQLMNEGMYISPNGPARQKVLELLLSFKPQRHIKCVTRLGWHDDEAFVFPDSTVSEKGRDIEILIQNTDRSVNKFRTAGTLEQWQKEIAANCRGNSRLMFALSASFAASLLPIAEETSGGFHFHGGSSTGKTTTLFVAGSVWGGDNRKGFLETWRGTANGLEAVAESHNHSILLLDEISQVSPHEVGTIVYNLANGFGKVRMSRTISVRKRVEWNLLMLSSGEKTLSQMVSSVGGHIVGGQDTRFVNIPVDAGADLGIFEDLHGYTTPGQLAQHLSNQSKKTFGTPIRAFIQSVCDNRALVKQRLEQAKEVFNSLPEMESAGGEVFRVGNRFALALAAGCLAAEFGVLDWTAKEIRECCIRIFREWIADRGTSGAYDVAHGVREVQSFIRQNGSRFQSMVPVLHPRTGEPIEEKSVRDRAGFYRVADDGSNEFLIFSEVFSDVICKGNQPLSVARELERRGLLKKGRESRSLLQRLVLPDGLGRQRVYVISLEEAEENDTIGVLNKF